MVWGLSSRLLCAALLGVCVCFVGAGSGCNLKSRSFYSVKDPAVVLYRAGRPGWFRERTNWQAQLDRFMGYKAGGASEGTHLPYKCDELGSADKVEVYVRHYLDVIFAYHSAYNASIYFRIASGKTLFDVTEIGLALATTIVGGETSKTILAAITTAVLGIEESLSEQFLQNQTSFAILNQMKAQANTKRAAIIRQLNASGYETKGEADVVLVDYFESGSLVSAITQLSEDAAAAAKESERELRAANAGEAQQTEGLRRVLLDWLDDPTAHDTRFKRLIRHLEVTLARADTGEAVILSNDEDAVQKSRASAWLYSPRRSVRDLDSARSALGLPTPADAKQIEESVQRAEQARARTRAIVTELEALVQAAEPQTQSVVEARLSEARSALLEAERALAAARTAADPDTDRANAQAAHRAADAAELQRDNAEDAMRGAREAVQNAPNAP
ncbi:MAG: hypothetical protein AAGD32_18375 [Planctomycetota bacterium]